MVNINMKKMYLILVMLSVSLLMVGCGNQQLVGNDTDEHGCIGSAGYSWCEAKQKCIRPWEENCTQEQQIQEVFDVKINSLTCDWTVKTGDYGVKRDCVRITSKGTAQGPVGARVELPILAWSDDKFDCGAWTLKTGALIAVGSTCVRKEGQPETTNWAVDTGSDRCPLKDYFDNERSHSVKIYNDNNLDPKKEDRKNIVCQ